MFHAPIRLHQFDGEPVEQTRVRRWGTVAAEVVYACNQRSVEMPHPDVIHGDPCGTRVLFIGNTLVEREQEYGDWELQLTLAGSPRKVVYRNLGWSGDTVWAESRGMFDPPAKGYQRMTELVRELKPTTIILGYGTVESEKGQTGLKEFSAQYQVLRNELLKTDARLIHLSPVLLELATFPVQSDEAAKHVKQSNANIDLYADTIQQIAAEADELFIDFRPAQRKLKRGESWTENGLHLSKYGYAQTSQVLVEGLGGEFRSGEFPELRAAIQRKNELFFHRWRPQNFTYLLGFRQHEQGQNAVEIAQFDPLVADVEQRISELAASALK